MPTTPSFEDDLRAAREARGLSLAEIQDQTRIPVDVLSRFESGDLVNDPTYNEVYLKAFLQSYSKAVGIPPSKTAAAFAEQKAGRYAGSLHPEFDPATAPAPSEPRRPDAPAASPDAPAATPPAASAPAVDALSSTPNPASRPRPAEAPQTLAQARVNRPAVPTAKHSFEKNWGVILGLFGLLVVGLAAAMYFLVFAGDDDVDTDAEVVAVGAESDVAIDSAGVGTGAAAGPRFQRPIRVTATAAGGTLSPLRVFVDGDYGEEWLEAGNSVTLEADSALVIDGVGSTGRFQNAVLEWQGQRFTPQPGAPLTISAATGQGLLDSLSAVPVGAPEVAPGVEPVPAGYDGE